MSHNIYTKSLKSNSMPGRERLDLSCLVSEQAM